MSDDQFDLENLKFASGLSRIYSVLTAIHGFDWIWFLEKLNEKKTVITTETDQKKMEELIKYLMMLQPVIEYFDKRGLEIKNNSSKASMN